MEGTETQDQQRQARFEAMCNTARELGGEKAAQSVREDEQRKLTEWQKRCSEIQEKIRKRVGPRFTDTILKNSPPQKRDPLQPENKKRWFSF